MNIRFNYTAIQQDTGEPFQVLLRLIDDEIYIAEYDEGEFWSFHQLNRQYIERPHTMTMKNLLQDIFENYSNAYYAMLRLRNNEQCAEVPITKTLKIRRT